MFFSDHLLTDKTSPLGIAWLAATLGPKNANRRVTKKEVSRYDLVEACDYIAEPPEPLALRTSGILLYGVARGKLTLRVYNQHYEEFHHNVTRFHHDVNRAIQSNFATTVNGRIVGNQGIDLVDDGTSRLDAITFAGIDFGWQSGIDFDLGFINWNDPLGERNRRESSKLESQSSQLSQITLEEEDEEEELFSDDEVEGRRSKRPKLSSSLPGSQNRKRSSSIAGPTRSSQEPQPLIDSEDNPAFIDLELDLDGPQNQDPNSSWTAPDNNFDEQYPNPEDFDTIFNPPATADRATADRATPPVRPAPRTPGTKRQRDTDDSAEEVEDELAPKKKVKKVRHLRLDKNVEVEQEDDRDARRRYKTQMAAERQALQAKESGKEIGAKVDQWVDNAGGWLDVLDEALVDTFVGMTKVEQFKWERDLAAHKLGGPRVEAEQDQAHPEMQDQDQLPPYDPDQRDVFNEDVFQQTNEDESKGYNDIFHETFEPLRDPVSAPTRGESADVNPEDQRRASRARPSLPWEGSQADQDDLLDPDSSFSPAGLLLSHMTPQEARIRMSSKSKSGSGVNANRRARSRSGSVLDNKAARPAEQLMDIDDEDDTLPQNIKDMADEPSQYDQLPAPYAPESLATLEWQCRRFLSFVENRMTINDADEIEFDELVPPATSKKNAAATAFYNCLTLATKRLIQVDQPEAFESFSIQFTAKLKL